MMTLTSTTGPSRTAQLTGGIGFALAAVAVVLANTDVPAGDNGGTGPMLVGIAIAAAAALAYALLLYPRSTRPATSALILAVLAALTAPIYWIGLPLVLGPGAFALARRAPGSRAAASAQIISVLAVAGALAVLAHDQL
jgi:hypothetical protein